MFRLTSQQAEGLIGSIVGLPVPDHTTLSRRAAMLDVPRPGSARTGAGSEPLHLGVDAGTGWIVTATLTSKDVDDAFQVDPLLDQVAGPVASFTGDGAYDQNRVYAGVAKRHPEAAVVVPPRATAVPSDAAQNAPTQRDGHVQHIARHGRMRWQTPSGYNSRARVEATMNRWK